MEDKAEDKAEEEEEGGEEAAGKQDISMKFVHTNRPFIASMK
jgi:hypothetical protein